MAGRLKVTAHWLAVLRLPVAIPPAKPTYMPAALLPSLAVERKLVVGNPLWGKVSDGLQQGLSPEQVAGTLKRMNEPVRLCHETIYQAIYVMPKGKLRNDKIALLRFGHNKRRPRSRGVDRRGQIPNMTRIDLHPADIAERLVSGHWEGDHIKGAGNRSQVGTWVERKTRYVALVKLSNGAAQATTEGFGINATV